MSKKLNKIGFVSFGVKKLYQYNSYSTCKKFLIYSKIIENNKNINLQVTPAMQNMDLSNMDMNKLLHMQQMLDSCKKNISNNSNNEPLNIKSNNDKNFFFLNCEKKKNDLNNWLYGRKQKHV